ncbi:ABC-F family ATP-binding cassette domain-containing protein [soil metagenome]
MVLTMGKRKRSCINRFNGLPLCAVILDPIALHGLSSIEQKTYLCTLMISVANLSVTFGSRDLFKEISFVMNAKDRIGLVGKNGVGKSTLLKILAGHQPPTKGAIMTGPGETIGYLPQEISNDSTKTIMDETMTAFDEVLKMEQEIEHINEQLATREDYESDDYMEMINRLSDCHERVHTLGAGKMESEVIKTLKGLGFSDADMVRPMTEFSGGWQMRVELAKLLLQKPSLLLLDEPTNHLDIESILWLEQVFINYPGALLMVSHDRAFLDNVTNRTIEIVFGKIYDYKANYTKFFELREERLEQQQNAYKNQQRYIAQQERFIERFKAKASKATQAKSAQKQLDKVERIEFDDLDNSSIQFHFPKAPRSGDVVLRAEQLNKSYGTKEILKNLIFDITRGERVAFVGKNGMGKSTLVKMINGETDAQGILKIGHNVEIGYYAQIQEKTLNENRTVIQTIEDVATHEWTNQARVRGLLGAFLFGEEEIDKKVKVLSGGEKSRLALARMLLRPVNLLILDEPTNHLDIASKEVLKEALLRYDGTLILVSHDRDFLQGLTNKTFEFTNKRIVEHYGDIQVFLDSHAVDSFRDFETSKDKDKALKAQAFGKATPAANETAAKDAQKKEQEKDLRKLKNELKQEEDSIERLEKEIAGILVQLQDPELFKDDSKSKQVVKKHDDLKQQLAKSMKRWEELGVQLEGA